VVASKHTDITPDGMLGLLGRLNQHLSWQSTALHPLSNGCADGLDVWELCRKRLPAAMHKLTIQLTLCFPEPLLAGRFAL